MLSKPDDVIKFVKTETYRWRLIRALRLGTRKPQQYQNRRYQQAGTITKSQLVYSNQKPSNK